MRNPARITSSLWARNYNYGLNLSSAATASRLGEPRQIAVRVDWRQPNPVRKISILAALDLKNSSGTVAQCSSILSVS